MSPPSFISPRSRCGDRHDRWLLSIRHYSRPPWNRIENNHDSNRLCTPQCPPATPRGGNSCLRCRTSRSAEEPFWLISKNRRNLSRDGEAACKGGLPQYRIRSEEERYERMVTQDSLEPVSEASGGDNKNLVERTFGHGQGTKTQQSRTPETETGKSGAKN